MDIKTINVESNGLGEVIRVQRPMSDFEYFGYVYFRPYNGSYISHIKVEETKTTGTTANHSNVSHLAPQYKGCTTWMADSYRQHCEYGDFFIAEEYRKSEAGTFYETDYSERIINYTIIGTPDVVSLEVVGDGYGGWPTTERMFLYGNGYGTSNPENPTETNLFIRRVTNSPHEYTNIVFFNGGEEKDKLVFAKNIQHNTVAHSTYERTHPLTYNGSQLGNSNCITNDLKIETSIGNNKISLIKLYADCRLCVFNLGTISYDDVSSEDAYSQFKHTVHSIYPTTANKLKDANFDEDLFDLYYGTINIPNGCLTVNVGEQKKLLYPDINVHDRISEHFGNADPRVQSMVDENSGTIPDDLLWVENLKDRNDKQISRYTHVVRLLQNSGTAKVSEILSAESSYARFTGYWRVHHSQYFDEEDKHRVGFRYIGENSSLPINCGNIFAYPVFKPWAECDLLVFQENDGTFASRYAGFFRGRLDDLYSVGLDSTGQDITGFGKKFNKNWYVNANDSANNVRKKLCNFAKTVSPYKNLILCCRGVRTEYFAEYPDKSGKSYMCVSSDKDMTPAMLQDMVKVSKYWWSDTDWKESLRLCLGLFSCASYSSGFQDEITRPVLGNCVVHDSSKLVPDLDNMFYILGATATHLNYGSSDATLELPVMNIALGDYATYSSFSDRFNNIVNNLKTDIFGQVTKFYMNYHEDMVKCLKLKDDEAVWERTYDTILDDLKNCGRRYFSIPYREPNDTRRNSTDAWIQLHGDWNGEYEELNQYVHDGFVGLIRRNVFGVDGPNQEVEGSGNTRQYFLKFGEDDILGQMAYGKYLTRLNNGLHELNEGIKSTVKDKLGTDYPEWCKILALTEPVCGCSGAYGDSDAQFMANPHKDCDDWLTDDNELEALEDLTKDCIIYNKQM